MRGLQRETALNVPGIGRKVVANRTEFWRSSKQSLTRCYRVVRI